MTGSKDTFLKLWDLSTQHCIQTVVAHRSEVWTLDLNPEQELIFTGSGEGEMKAWKIDHEALAGGLRETESGEVRNTLGERKLFGSLPFFRSPSSSIQSRRSLSLRPTGFRKFPSILTSHT